MNIPQNFAFFGQRKTLSIGVYKGKIVDFEFKERTSKAGKPYITLSAKVQIATDFFNVSLSLDPAEKGKATNDLILQLSKQTGKTEEELIDMCANPIDFFNLAKDKIIDVISTPKGYIDIKPENYQEVKSEDIPF